MIRTADGVEVDQIEDDANSTRTLLAPAIGRLERPDQT